MKYLFLLLVLGLGYEGYTHWSDIEAKFNQVHAQVLAAKTQAAAPATAAKSADPLSIPGEPAANTGQAATAAASTAPAPAAAPAATAKTVADSQRMAVAKYPALSVANSEMNSRFVFRYKRMLQEKSPRLQDPAWPMQLADECADAIAASAPKPKSPGSDKPHQTSALASTRQTPH